MGLLVDPVRLAAVARILPVAEAAREAVDRLAELAAVVMDAPIGFVGLIGAGHLYVVALVGLSRPLRATRRLSTRSGGYPLAALLAGEAAFIEDGAEAPRFVERWDTRLSRLGAWAAVPLRDPAGHVIGVLGVGDTRRRRWRPEARDALSTVALSLERELALRGDEDRRQPLESFDDAPSLIAVTRGQEHRLDYLNPAYREVFGELPVGAPARTALSALPEGYFTLMDEVLATGKTHQTRDAAIAAIWPGEKSRRTRYFDLLCSRISTSTGERGGLLTVAVEVTDRVAAHQGLERHAGRQEVLARGTAALHRTLDPDAELRALGWAAVPQLADLSTVHRLMRPVPAGALPPLPVITERVVAAAAATHPDLPGSEAGLSWDVGSPIVEAVRVGATIGQPFDAQHPPGWARDFGRAGVLRDEMQHVAAAPVIVDGLVVAVVVHWRRADRAAWTGDDLRVLGQLADHAGHALAHGLSYQHTRAAALTLQRSLLTEPPTVPGLDIRVRYQPAGADEIGGDWYDTVLLDDDTLAVTVGDVIGHGITAASAMGDMRATLRSILALDLAEDPADALAALDTATRRLDITRFATVIHGRLRRVSDGWGLRWASAGHPPPLMLTADAGPLWLDHAGGLVIGTGLAHPGRSSAAAILRPGDSLLLFTDGLFERREQVVDDDLNHLATIAAAHSRQSLDTLCDVLLGDAATDDDVAILAVRAAST
jgi:GAF domain-containing protein